jgi:C4-dicarboxylate-specific signal transduction histidine kinase
MRGRLVTVALAIALLTLGIVTLSLMPVFDRLANELAATGLADSVRTMRGLVRTIVLLDLVLVTGVVFTVLYLSFGLPLARAERTVDQIASDDVDVGLFGGPLLVRLERSLRRLSSALKEERDRNRSQLEHLTQTNERLVRLQAELVTADRLATVGKLAAGVAHEVGNPLAGILGYVSVLRMRAKNEEATEVLDRVEHEVQRIDSIVRSLLELGRPSRGKAQPVDARTTIDSAVRLLGAGRDFSHVKTVIDAPESLWLRAETGPLSQVLINLLINAAQLMTAGTITVRARIEGDRGLITVEDEGPGFTPEVQARLFEPFFTTRPPGQGTGLGLAISRHLLAQFEGTLTAANREAPATGACFTISLPVP